MHIAPIYTVNIDVHSTHIHNQYTCILHTYMQAICMYIAQLYTINIHVNITHIHNQYTCM